MDWLIYLITLAIFGLIVGAFARLALPGKDPMSLFATMALGLAGSFVGGIVLYIVTGGRYTARAGSSRSSAPSGSSTSSAAAAVVG